MPRVESTWNTPGCGEVFILITIDDVAIFVDLQASEKVRENLTLKQWFITLIIYLWPVVRHHHNGSKRVNDSYKTLFHCKATYLLQTTGDDPFLFYPEHTIFE